MALKGFKLSHILVKFFSYRVKELKPTLSAASEEEDVMKHSKINMSSGFIIAWETHPDWRIAVHGVHPSPHPGMLGVSLLTGVDGHSNM